MSKKIIGFIVVGICVILTLVIIFLSNSSISNQVLTKENFNELTQEYAEKNKDSDDLLYFTYAISNYMLTDGISAAFNFEMTDEQKQEQLYKPIYGKTINTLVKEGKNLMNENNISPEEFKSSMQNLSSFAN